jgi:hypothetical protein
MSTRNMTTKLRLGIRTMQLGIGRDLSNVVWWRAVPTGAIDRVAGRRSRRGRHGLGKNARRSRRGRIENHSIQDEIY